MEPPVFRGWRGPGNDETVVLEISIELAKIPVQESNQSHHLSLEPPFSRA